MKSYPLVQPDIYEVWKSVLSAHSTIFLHRSQLNKTTPVKGTRGSNSNQEHEIIIAYTSCHDTQQVCQLINSKLVFSDVKSLTLNHINYY